MATPKVTSTSSASKYNFSELTTPSDKQAKKHNVASIHNRLASSSEPQGSSTMPRTSSSSANLGSSVDPPSTGLTSRPCVAGQVTPHTSSTRRTPCLSSTVNTRSPEASSIVAVVEGRGLARGEIGIACIDLKKPELLLSQFSDSTTYVKVITKLQILHPLEILMPHTSCENGNMSKLFQQIRHQFPGVTLTSVQRKYFNETKGLQYVRHLCVQEFNSVEVQISSKYYCLATAAALLKYVEFIQNVIYAPNSLKVVFSGSEKTCIIDAHTARYLELIQNIYDPKSEHSLYGVLHNTQTVGGARLLRANLLQPPSDEQTVTTRQDCVTEFTEKEKMFYSVQSILGKFLDIDHLLSLCIQIPKQETVKTAENKITQIIYLKHTLELVEPLRAALVECENPLLRAYLESLNDVRYGEILTKIGEVIQEDVKYHKGALSMRVQKCFAVKPNINGLLDIARRSYCEIVDDIAEMVKQLGEEHNLPIRVAYNVSRGFFIQMCVPRNESLSLDTLPAVFIKKNKFKSMISFTTEDMVKMNDRVRESLNEIYMMSNVIISELLRAIRDKIGCLYKLTDIVAMVDLLVCFTHTCTMSQYVRPEFTDTLAIKQGRHPILEKITAEPAKANNTYLSEDSNFMIITGPNMSGKSTYLKQVALLQVMAQIGSFVPAQYASFRIVDHLFTRMGSNDDIETNASTFMMEMREANYIVQNATDKSLIVIDELGRGTSIEEGIGICHAICEHLLSFKAFSIVATHFNELTRLDMLYPNVLNFHFKVHEVASSSGDSIHLEYTHELAKGVCTQKDYGLKLAEVSTMPKVVVEDAKLIAQELRAKQQKTVGLSRDEQRQRAVFHLASRLIQLARNSRMDKQLLNVYVKSLREEYLQSIQNANEDGNGSEE